MIGPEYYARYPFLRVSSQYIRDNGPNLEQLLDGREYARVREQGWERVLSSLEKEEITIHSIVTSADQFVEILSYPVARIIVSAVNDPFLIKRYALAEAERAHKLLGNEKPETIIDISEELGLNIKIEEELSSDKQNLILYFADYLRYSSTMRGGTRGEWKLINQELRKGFVRLSNQKFLRILQQVIQVKIEKELPLELEKYVKDKFKDQTRLLKTNIDAHKKTYKAEDVGRLTIINLPPCMRRLLSMAQMGENIPHQGRFALTSFLHTLGMSADDIIRLFSLSPDFDPKKSRYQVEHITGVISSTEYTPPECSTMKTYGICFDPDDLCKREWMTHPLKYYRTKMGKRRRTKNNSQQSDETKTQNDEKNQKNQ